MRHLVLALLLAGGCSKAPSPTVTKPPAAMPAETPSPTARPAETAPPATKPAETPPPAEPPPPPGSRQATCAELAAKTQASTGALAKDLAALGLADALNIDSKTFGTCMTDASGKGAWILTLEKSATKLESAAVGEDPAEYSIDRLIALVYVAEDGKAQRLELEANSDTPGFNVRHDRLYEHDVAIERVFDWDDDGHVDVALRNHYKGPDSDRTEVALVRLHEGEPGPWDLGDIKIIEVRDGDEDGRPDLLSLEPFAWGPRGDVVPGTVRYLHRSTKGGFVTDDDGVKAYYKKACGGAKVELGAAPKGDVMDQLVCARLWGASVKDVQSRLDAFMEAAEAHPLDDPDNPPYLVTTPVTLE